MKNESVGLKLVKTSYVLVVILAKVKAFEQFIEKDKKITKETLNVVLKNISLCSNINTDLMFFIQHQQRLVESFDKYNKAVLYYLSKNNNQIIKMLEEEIKKEKTILI